MRNGKLLIHLIPQKQHGFTYIGLLLAVALLGATLAAAGSVWHTTQQRARERQLLYAGDQIRQAIGRYYHAHVASQSRQYPQHLEDLLRDPRLPGVAHYLRKLYYDPITGSQDWGLIKTENDRIAGVFSRSEHKPIKQANFGVADRDFEGKETYSQWTFVYQPGGARAVQRLINSVDKQ